MSEYIYTLKSELLSRIVTEYIDYITNDMSIHRPNPEFENVSVYGPPSVTERKPRPLKFDSYTRETLIYNLPRPQESTARTKIQMICNILYRGYLRSEDGGSFHIKSTTLKAVTDNYRYILNVLRFNHIIDETRTFTEDNDYDRIYYRICDPSQFHLYKVTPLLKKEISRGEKQATKIFEERKREIIEATSQQFVDRYDHNLRQLRVDAESARKYIRTEYGEETHAGQTRIYTVEKISQKRHVELTSIDSQGRLYHIGTQLQRDIKPYTNIRYTIDCKNSHPYLLTHPIITYIIKREISTDRREPTKTNMSQLIYYLTRHVIDNKGIYIHYEFSDTLCKILDDSGLDKSKIAKALRRLKSVKPDVWQYVYDAATGQVWDNFVDEFNEERTTVKQKIFESVVYSYTKRRDKKKEDENKWLRAFITRYPTVYDYILKIKRYIHRQCVDSGRVRQLKVPIKYQINEYNSVSINSKDEVLLATVMMRLESDIFTEILRRLFNKRIVCFGIHDAVAVIHSKLSEEEIKSVMMNVYADYGLIPTLSVEKYSR